MTDRTGRLVRYLLALDLILLVLLLGWVIAQAVPSSEAVRLRNALIYKGSVSPAEVDWSPTNVPAEFILDDRDPPSLLRDAIRVQTIALQPDNWHRALAIATSLQGNMVGTGPIMAGLEDTYIGIVFRGEGYCGDYANVFAALANAAGIPNRRWSFSFDGYGGHGHIFNEVWDEKTTRWLAIDVFNNYLFVDAGSGEPLSAIEFRSALRGERAAVRIVQLNPAARPGFAIPEKATDYYRRGASEWYLLWGNNVSAIDGHPVVRAARHVSRHLEQFSAILIGLHPDLRIIETPESKASVQALAVLGTRLQLAGWMGVLLSVLAVILSLRLWRERTTATTAGNTSPNSRALHIGIVGPLPPPSGGMANQCRQLCRLLKRDGVIVEQVQTNAPYRPAWVGGIPILRACFRLLPYLAVLWRAAGRNEVLHVFANSGWAWYLCAAPAIAAASFRGTPVIVNYRGGNADPFLASHPPFVARQLASAHTLVTPSGFLRDVFAKYGLSASIVPNIVDLDRFSPRPWTNTIIAPHLIVTRNLEPIYDIPTAIRAFAIVRRRFPSAILTVAGSGPDLGACVLLATELDVNEAVQFAGRIDNDHIVSLYASADVAINPSTVDNMPISILEAYASGVPVVSTDVGGIPYIADNGRTALLVPPRQPEAMATAVLRVLDDRALAQRLMEGGLAEAANYAWPEVRNRWLDLYWNAARPSAALRKEPA